MRSTAICEDTVQFGAKFLTLRRNVLHPHANILHNYSRENLKLEDEETEGRDAIGNDQS